MVLLNILLTCLSFDAEYAEHAGGKVARKKMNIRDCIVHSAFRACAVYNCDMKRILSSILVFGLMSASPAMAQGWAQTWSSGEAREAVEEGKNVPLSQIFRQLKSEYGGYQLGAELFSRGSGAEYVIDWMTDDGRKMRFRVDARTGRITSRKGG